MEINTSTVKYLLIGMLIVNLLLFAYLVGIVLKNKQKLDLDPLTYGSMKYGIDYCSCFSDDGVHFSYNRTAYWFDMIPGSNRNSEINETKLKDFLSKKG